MAHILGNLAAAAAGNWKRSAAIVAAVLVGIGILAGTVGNGFADGERIVVSDIATPIEGMKLKAVDPSRSGD